MGAIKEIIPAKLIAGFIFGQERLFQNAKSRLRKKFGLIDFESDTLPFTHTQYYDQEIGENLKRKFISFKKLILPSELASIKIYTNRIENIFTRKSKRQINIDPGYIELSKLILATTKNYKHRIYLNKGIYAEATLYYQNHTFRAWGWTYPDYQTQEYIDIFNKIRLIYTKQITNSKK